MAGPGSVLDGADLDPLSDLDVVGVTAVGRDEEAANALEAVYEQTLHETAVALETTWVTKEQATNGDHTFTKPVYEWLRREAERHPDNVIGRNPTELIIDPIVDLENDMNDWFTTMKKNFQKQIVSGARELSWTLSLPHIAARRSIDVLKCMQRPCNIDQAPLDVTRQGIFKAVEEVYGAHDTEIWQVYQEVDALRQEYLAFLLGRVSLGGVSRNEYSDTIKAMSDKAIPSVLRLLKLMHDAFNDVGYQVYDDAYFASVLAANSRTPAAEIFMDYRPPGSTAPDEWRLVGT